MGKRKATTKRVPPGVPIDDYFDRQMKDPEFARAYEELGPEFEIVDQIITLRRKRKMTQRDLAAKVGTQQPSIARFERRRATTDLGFLRRVADALDADVKVSLVPRQAMPASKGSRR